MTKSKRKRAARPANRADGEKPNSNTLCGVLQDIRENIHLLPVAAALGIERPLNREDFAQQVLNVAARHRSDLALHEYTGDIVGDLESNARNLRYFDLQLYADIVGVPLALLLLFSRMKSNTRKTTRAPSETNALLINALREIFAKTDPAQIAPNTLREWSIISNKFGLSLPSFAQT